MKICRRLIAALGIVLGYLAVFASPALAHGAWLGGGSIGLSDASRAQMVANIQAGQPAVTNGDTVDVIADFPVIAEGTLDGPGGYATFYVPEGLAVAGVWITDAAGNPLNARPARASTGSGVSKGWGPKGQLAFDVTANGWQPSSTAECSLAGFATADCNGGLAYVYGDTGVFYSTRADTALFANGSDVATLENGYLVDPTNGSPWGSVGGTGTARVHNKWDAVQLNAFGSGGSIFDNGFSAAEQTTITGGRGTTPYRAGSPVAGPESGADWDRYGTTGPWNRIQYDGSCKADDALLPGRDGPANGDGSVSPETTDPGVNSADVCSVTSEGYALNISDDVSLPADTNAVRFAFGGIADGETFYAIVRYKITDLEAIGPVNAEGHGGDSAQGASAGNDNPWRYWVAGSSTIRVAQPDDLIVGISIVSVNGAPYAGGDIPQAATLRYRIVYANASLSALSDAVLSATLPSQATGTENFSVINGPDILPDTNPVSGTFSFKPIGDLRGLASGAIEFDVTTNATAGQSVTASTQITTTEIGPVTDSVSTNVDDAVLDDLPGCTGQRIPAVDWLNDIPGAFNTPQPFSRVGISGDVTISENGSALPPRTPSFSSDVLFFPESFGENPVLNMQYARIDARFDTPLNAVRFQVADLEADESTIIYGLDGAQIVTPSIRDRTGSGALLKQTRADGTVLVERLSALDFPSIDDAFAFTVGFNRPVDRVVIIHGRRQSHDLGVADSAKFTDLLTCADFTDAPSGLGDTFHNMIASLPLYLGGNATGDLGPYNSANADGDADGGVSIPPLTQGFLATIVADVSGEGGLLQGWIDWNGDGSFDVASADVIATDLRDDGTGGDEVANDGQIQIQVTVPGDAVLDQTFARFRWSRQGALDPTTPAPDGEVEDYAVTIAAAPLVDRGDAPVSYGDPQHIIADAVVAGTYLGTVAPDADTPQHSADATGDDADGGLPNDEDGVVMPVLYPGTTQEITVTVSEIIGALGPLAYLQAWIDFDGDGSFDQPVDMIVGDLQDGGAADADGTVNGQIVLQVGVPATATTGPTFARFRWSTTSGVVQVALDGEVEDYQVTISSGTPPLACDRNIFATAGKPTNFLRMDLEEGTGGYTLDLPTLGSSGEDISGAYGYSDVDNYVYGVEDGGKTLWRIDGAGDFIDLGQIPGVGNAKDAGDVLPGGIMVYELSDDSWQLVDISAPTAPVSLGELTLSRKVDVADIVYNPVDGRLWSIDRDSGRLISVSANGGTAGAVAVQEAGPSSFTGTYGALWFDQDGNLFAYEDGSNRLFLIDTATGSATFLATSSAEEGDRIDGASCRGPSPLDTSGIAGNVYVDQNASDVKDGAEPNLGGNIAISVFNDAGTRDDTSDDLLVATGQTAADGTYAVEGLLTGFTYRVEVDESDPDLPPGSTIGTSNPLLGISVTRGALTSEVNFGFDPQQADLAITKTAVRAADGTPLTAAAEGDVIDWIISVSNSGPGSPSGVKVKELIPSGFTYISDTAPATGDTYDPGTGLWFVDEILSGATETLVIRTRVEAQGQRTNVAEITQTSLPDIDSDAGTGPLVDDFSDGVVDDDEATYTVVLDNGTSTLSGRILVDTGSGGGIAHDAQLNGEERGTADSILSILDSGGGLIAQPKIAADGGWSYTLGRGTSGQITLALTAAEGTIPVSEATNGLPSLVNADPHDGRYSFTPAEGTDYADLNFGVIGLPELTEDQSASIEPGQIATLLHSYTASSAGSVTFAIRNEKQATPDSFSTAIFIDNTCNGEPDTPHDGSPIPVVAGQGICLVTRTSSSSGAGQGARYSYDITALTNFEATTLSHTAVNTDSFNVGAGLGQLTLSKSVRNVTLGTPEGAQNSGSPGDVLEYRIYLSNPSASAAHSVIIYDRTPAYTVLAEPVQTPVLLSPEMSCDLVVPTSNIAGYDGPVRWNCTGRYLPASNGSVAFRVRISP